MGNTRSINRLTLPQQDMPVTAEGNAQLLPGMPLKAAAVSCGASFQQLSDFGPERSQTVQQPVEVVAADGVGVPRADQQTHPNQIVPGQSFTPGMIVTMSFNNMEAQPRQMNHYNPRPPKPRTSSSSSQGYEGNFQGGRANFEPGYQGAGMAGGYGGGGGQQHNHHPQFPQQQQFPPQQMFQNQFVPGQGYPPGMMGGMMPQQVYFVSNPAVPVYAQYGNQQPRMPDEMDYGGQLAPRSDNEPPRSAGNSVPDPEVRKVKLVHEVIPSSENAWKPSMKKDQPVDENERVLMEVRDLLNKLTPTTYGKLMQRMVEGQIPFYETAERLRATVGLIFDTALEEPNYADYAELYAKMCRDLIKTEARDARGEVVKFRTVLLQQTQRYFEGVQDAEGAEDDKIEGDSTALQEKRAKTRRRYLRNICFISELYKVEMLTDRVILSCFQKLLPKKSNSEDADEEKLECLCKLLQTCGKMIKEQNRIDIILGQLKKMINAGVSSSRIRFMMQDTIDLKNNNYVPRRTIRRGPTITAQVRAAEAKEVQDILQAWVDQDPVQLPRHVQIAPRGGRAIRRGRWMMITETGRGISQPSKLSLAVPSTKTAALMKGTAQRELELSCGDIHELAKTQRWGDVTVELLKKERFLTYEDIMTLCKADFQEQPLNAIPLRDRKSILAWIEGNASTEPSALEVPKTLALAKRNSTISGDQKATQSPEVSTADPSALAKNSINDQKHILGEKLLLFVQQLYPDFIGKVTSRVTDMLLELDNAELLRLLDSPDELKTMVDQAVAILRNYWPAGDAPA